MGLCGPHRCGCAFSSDSFSISGTGEGGDPLQIETYAGVATQVPDTRPGPAVRFEGMRVYCTDTDRTFLWENSSWRCISQPLIETALTRTRWNIGTGGSEAAGYSRFGHQVMVQYESSFGTGFAADLGVFTMPVPARWVVHRQMGTAAFYDISTGIIYHGSCDLNNADGLMRLYSGQPGHYSPTATNPFTWAVGDQMWFKIVYDAADTV